MRYVAIGLILIAIIWFTLPFIGPAPAAPAPERLAELDPLVAKLVEDGLSAARSNRRNHALRLQLGMIYQANGLDDLAAATYEQVRRARPRDAQTWYYLALLEESRANADAAIELMRRCIELDPEYAAAQWRLGHWLLDAGRVGEAQETFARVVESQPERPALFGMARTLIAQERLEEAIALLQERLLSGPDAGYAQHLLADAYRRAGRLEDAERAIARASEVTPQWSDPWNAGMRQHQTGYATMRKAAENMVAAGRFAEAIELLERLRRETTVDAALLNMLGVAHVASGRTERGLAILREAVELNPRDYPSRLNLARAYLRTGADSPASLSIALSEAIRAIELSPTGTAWALRGQILERLGRIDAAVTAYRTAYEHDAREADPMLRAARLMIEQERWEEAEEIARTVLHRSGDTSGDARVFLAIVRMGEGRLDAAAAELERADRLGTANEQLLYEAETKLARMRREAVEQENR